MIFLPSYGVGRLAQLYCRLSVFLTKFAHEALAIEKSLNSELYQHRLLSLQNRQALDYVLASQGGVCALVGSECCTYVPEHSQDINKHVLSAEQAFEQWKAREGEPTVFDSLGVGCPT
ncbi:endogenous retrovirus group PABLB member 1 Env polyprotein [Chelydra serpentina]|uniref:Endogenous retrovirus group PABLB member 1 Env polyprotein n=1 Tax=Chelydra serpentina TaxID=8475 RepID=A0A8T1S6V7_CHESE|nr:endogenous retrovirus group PABLB member 1 Env polyprotein [Chelydra serpentina]